MQAQTLQVPGATLYYEVRGSGPVLLLISGGSTDADIFQGIADLLAPYYTVVTYDTRGNSRSTLEQTGEDLPIEIHSEDARRLLEAVSDQPAFIFGSSSGAIVGLDLITRYPEKVARLIAHEPPMVEVLPDAATWRAFFRDVYETYKREGEIAAQMKFAAGTGLADPEPTSGQVSPDSALLTMMDRIMSNFRLFFAHLLIPFTSYQPDVSTLDKRHDAIILAGGQASSQHLPYRPARWLAERWGKTVINFPGGHAGYANHAEAFAQQLREVLA